MTIAEILTESGYAPSGRKSAEKAINNAISQGVIIKIAPKRKTWRDETGKEYNVKVSHTGWDRELRHDVNHYLVDYDKLAEVLGRTLSNKWYRDISSKIEGHECGRCCGNGYIKEYSHVYNGVCFKCAGLGKIR